uniref:Ovule protein n=1 Tax=Steinernema glaseri TaxID=37863 RepID=A0A1I8A558_9BILA
MEHSLVHSLSPLPSDISPLQDDPHRVRPRRPLPWRPLSNSDLQPQKSQPLTSSPKSNLVQFVADLDCCSYMINSLLFLLW